ncbi:MAG: DUF928 domain-containing protein [Leptolyngbyaceae cyanobacterium SL_7_1]|nr:DUF928 domain-containing protein [Leptolyngbyaceae cyanobacterium SL_7_1]
MSVAFEVVSVIGITVTGLSFPVLAQQYNPPDWGLPGRREGGGTRGCWVNQSDRTSDIPLTALVPSRNVGYTSAAYPSFFVYVPQFYAEQAAGAEFLLSDAEGNEVYVATFQTNANAGIVRLNLPDTGNLPPLELGKTYRWSFSLICDMDDRSADLVVESWVERTELSPQLAATVQNATASQLPSIYAEAGIWYDALNSLAELPYQPGNLVPASQWTNLLHSVELDHIARDIPIESVELR